MLKREVKAVLFDLDGVLVDSMAAWYHTYNDSLKDFGFGTLQKQEFVKRFGSPIEKDIKDYFIGKTVNEVSESYNANFKRNKEYVKLSPESILILKKLKKQKIKICLISNSTKFIVLTVLNHFKIRKYFDVVITMDDVKRRKPAPDMVLKACKKLNISPKYAILVGDTKNDMIAGKMAGCITLGYKTKGDHRISHLISVATFLK